MIAPAPSARAAVVASVAAFLESDGFPRTLVAGLEVPTPLYAFGVAVLVRCR